MAEKHTDYIVDLANMQASVSLLNLKTEAVGKGMTRITVDLYNEGALPTHSQMGVRSKWLNRIKVNLKLGKGQEVIAGRPVQMISSVGGDDAQTLTWLVKGKGSLEITAGAPHVGNDTLTVTLK